MTRPRPQVQIIVDVEFMMREMVSTSEAQSQGPGAASPPKYEELEEQEAPHSPAPVSWRSKMRRTVKSQMTIMLESGFLNQKIFAVMEQSVRSLSNFLKILL